MNKLHLLIGLAFLATVTAPAQSKDQITVLKEPYLAKLKWKNAGFKTPQATAQTFMWAMREGNWKVIGLCEDSLEQIRPSEKDLENQKKASETAKGFQALAIRGVEDGVVELKFKVVGWKEEPFVHRFRKIKGEWKMDKSSSTRIAKW